MQKGYLIIDVGTGNTRAAVVTNDGDIISESRLNTEYIYEDADACHFVPQELWKAILQVSKDAVKDAPGVTIKAVSATSTRQGIVLIDEKGNALAGLPNIDNRGHYLEGLIDNSLIYKLTGRWAVRYFSAYKLCGFRDSFPFKYKRIRFITSISDWVGYMFTGKLVYEHSQACETIFYDTQKGCWSQQLCDLFDISQTILPETAYSGTILGEVRNAKDIGLSDDCVFAVGGADTQVAVKGINAQPGDAVIVSGTTTPVVLLSNQYLLDDAQRCWTNRHIVKDQFVLETNAGVTGLNYQRFKANFLPHVTYKDIEHAIDIQLPPGMMCCISTIDFSQNRPMTHGGFKFKVPIGQNFTPIDMAYSMLFNIACGIKNNFEVLCDISNVEGRLMGCGGGLQSRAMCELVAALTGRTLVLHKGFAQSSVLGIARLCSEQFGVQHSDMGEAVEFEPMRLSWLSDAYEQWLELRDSVNEIRSKNE